MAALGIIEEEYLERLLRVATCLAMCGYGVQVGQLAGNARAFYSDAQVWAAQVHHRGPRGRTHLMYAAWMGSTARVQYLLDRGARVDAGSVPPYASASPLTPLSMALAGGSRACAELLLAMGASLDRALEGLAYGGLSVEHDRKGMCGDLACSLLMRVSPAFSPWAAVNLGVSLRHPDLTGAAVRRLVEASPVVGDIDEGIQEVLYELKDCLCRGPSLLLRAFVEPLPARFFSDIAQAYAVYEDVERLAAALDTPFAMEHGNRATALWAAASAGMLERVERFFDPALRIESLPGLYSGGMEISPLVFAALNGHTNVVEFLVEHQMTPSQGTYAEKLQAAVEVGLAGHVRGLLEDHRDDIDLEEEMVDDGLFHIGSPRYYLTLACAEGHQGIVEMLVGAGASVHVGMDSQWSVPLIFKAAGLGDFCHAEVTDDARVALVKYLIQKGALYSAGQWAAFAVGKAHLDGLDVNVHLYQLDTCDVVKRAVEELGLQWGDACVV